MRINHWPYFSLVILLWLLLWWLCFWPGILSYDGMNYINIAADQRIDSLHSHLYSLLVWTLIQFTHQVTPLIVFQMVLAALVLGRCSALIWNLWRAAGKMKWFIFCGVTGLVFSPLTLIMSIEYISDDGFSFAFIGLLFELWGLARAKTTKISVLQGLLLFVYATVALFFRANGLILLLLLPPLCVWLFPRYLAWQINGGLIAIAVIGISWSALFVPGFRHPMVFPFALHSVATVIVEQGEDALSPQMRQILRQYTTVEQIKQHYLPFEWGLLIQIPQDSEKLLDPAFTMPQKLNWQFLRHDVWRNFATIAQHRWRIFWAMSSASRGYHDPANSQTIWNALAQPDTKDQVRISFTSPLPAVIATPMQDALAYSYQHLRWLWSGIPGLIALSLSCGMMLKQGWRTKKIPEEALLFLPLAANTVAVIIFSPAAEYRYWFPTTLALLPAFAYWGTLRQPNADHRRTSKKPLSSPPESLRNCN